MTNTPGEQQRRLLSHCCVHQPQSVLPSTCMSKWQTVAVARVAACACLLREGAVVDQEQVGQQILAVVLHQYRAVLQGLHVRGCRPCRPLLQLSCQRLHPCIASHRVQSTSSYIALYIHTDTGACEQMDTAGCAADLLPACIELWQVQSAPGHAQTLLMQGCWLSLATSHA